MLKHFTYPSTSIQPNVHPAWTTVDDCTIFPCSNNFCYRSVENFSTSASKEREKKKNKTAVYNITFDIGNPRFLRKKFPGCLPLITLQNNIY